MASVSLNKWQINTQLLTHSPYSLEWKGGLARLIITMDIYFPFSKTKSS